MVASHLGQVPSSEISVNRSISRRRVRMIPAVSAPINQGAWGGTIAIIGAITTKIPMVLAAPPTRHRRPRGWMDANASVDSNPKRVTRAVVRMRPSNSGGWVSSIKAERARVSGSRAEMYVPEASS